MICIIDYGAGNLRSVYNAFDLLGCDVTVSHSRKDIDNATKLVIPGVGSYRIAMEHFHKLGLVEAVRENVAVKGKPLLGICLGMQLLSDCGYEGGKTAGLGLIEGEVVRFELEDLHVPHVGWNDIELKADHPVFESINQLDRSFYFVHSYYFKPKNRDNIAATTDYGIAFASAVLKDNIIATQFHPEKSQENGLKLLENFAEWKV